MKNSVLDRLKSYFDEFFSDETKPTAKNLFLIVVSILALDVFRLPEQTCCRCTGYENILRAVKKTMLRRLGKDQEAETV